jgi:hypothetical protein
MDDFLKKKVYCDCLNKETDVEYRIGYVNGYKNGNKKRTIYYYNCESWPECQEIYVLKNCASLKEMKRTEAEIKLG